MHNEISSYAKLTAQNVSEQYMPHVSLDGAELLFKNPAFSNMMQPVLVMLRSLTLLEQALGSWSNCQKLLAQSVSAPVDSAKDEQSANLARERLYKDKEDLDSTTAEIIALGSTLKTIRKEVNAFLGTQLSPISQDMTTLKNLCLELQNEFPNYEMDKLLTDNLCESIFAALYTDKIDPKIASKAKDLGLDLNALSPLKKALSIAILSKNSE